MSWRILNRTWELICDLRNLRNKSKNIFVMVITLNLSFFYSGLVWKVFLRFIAANDKLAFMFSVYRYFLVIHLFFHVADMTSTCLTLFPPQSDRLFHDSPFLCIAHPWSHLDRWGISLSSSLVCSKSQFNEKSFNCRKYFRPPLFAHPEAKLIPWNTPVRRIVISNPHIPTLI